jgi:hypothetical protein
MRGRLNSFQKSMLQWNDLHAYNAAHVARVAGPLDVARLQAVIQTTLERKGLTGLVLDRSSGTYQYEGGHETTQLRVLAASPFSPSVIEEIECQLNIPFDPGTRFSPFRFFVVPESVGFSLGLVYFHAIADAECVVHLLRDLINSYGGKADASAARFDYLPSRQTAFSRLRPVTLLRKLLTLPGSIASLRRTCRPIYRDPTDFANKMLFFTLGSTALVALVTAARSIRVRLNDLFLALLMQAVGRLRADRLSSLKRRGISLGCIVNIRKDMGANDSQAFAPLLGSFIVHHEVPADVSLADLAKDIHRQTTAIKAARLYLGAGFELALGRLLISLFPADRRGNLYLKHYPLWGGISNMDLNPVLEQSKETQLVDYFRAVSTGPITPLVLSITTIGRVANFCLTYRSAVFSALDVEHIKNSFLGPLEPLAATP